jgi:hypothetical protein
MTVTVVPDFITLPVPPRAKLVLSDESLPETTKQELLVMARSRLISQEEANLETDEELFLWIRGLAEGILTDPDDYSFWWTIFETENFLVEDD